MSTSSVALAWGSTDVRKGVRVGFWRATWSAELDSVQTMSGSCDIEILLLSRSSLPAMYIVYPGCRSSPFQAVEPSLHIIECQSCSELIHDNRLTSYPLLISSSIYLPCVRRKHLHPMSSCFVAFSWCCCKVEYRQYEWMADN